MTRLLCWFAFHKWEVVRVTYWRIGGGKDVIPERRCKRCGERRAYDGRLPEKEATE